MKAAAPEKTEFARASASAEQRVTGGTCRGPAPESAREFTAKTALSSINYAKSGAREEQEEAAEIPAVRNNSVPPPCPAPHRPAPPATPQAARRSLRWLP